MHETLAVLVSELKQNARFYKNEEAALAEDIRRRDDRHLGEREAGTIAEFLSKAAEALANAINTTDICPHCGGALTPAVDSGEARRDQEVAGVAS